MAKTKDRVVYVAGSAKPYVERAIHDRELREHVKQAVQAARSIYDELVAPRGVTQIAARVAEDKDIQDNLRTAVAELRQAAGRLHSRRARHRGRNTFVLLAAVGAAVLYNPITGAETRRWLKEKLFGSDEFGYESTQAPTSGNGAAA